MQNKKTITAKVYGILIESQKNFFLSVQYAYCLEDAFYLAKLEFVEQNLKLGKMGSVLEGAKIGLFTTREISDLELDLTKVKQRETNSIYPIQEEKSKIDELSDELVDELFDELIGAAPAGLQPLKKKPELPKIEKKEVVEIKPPKTPTEIKNELMKKIIDNKDEALYRQNIILFTAAEKRYIQERLK